MIIIGSLVVVLTLCVWWEGSSGSELPVLIGFVSFVALLGVVLTLPIQHMDIRAEIDQYRATQSTLVTAREDGQTWESAAIQQEVVEANRWLANVRYWNGTVFDLWIPDEVEELKVIR